jgi:hypothetical protein
LGRFFELGILEYPKDLCERSLDGLDRGLALFLGCPNSNGI